MVDVILLEDGDSLLQETGDFILLETQSVTVNIKSKVFRLGVTSFNNKLVKDVEVIKLKKGGNIKI